MGFEYYAYRGLETGSRQWCSHVIKNGNIMFMFTSPLNPGEEEFAKHLKDHGDGVRDVAFLCDDARGIYNKAVSRGAKGIREPEELTDENGTMIVATI